MFIGQQGIGLQERVAVDLDHGREVNHHSALGRLDRGLETGSRDFALQEDHVGIGDGGGAGGDKGGVDKRVGTGGDDDGVLAIGRDSNDGEAGIGIGLLHSAEIDAGGAHIVHGRFGIGIGAHRAHKGHVGAQLRGRDCLVSALAPGQDVAARA